MDRYATAWFWTRTDGLASPDLTSSTKPSRIWSFITKTTLLLTITLCSKPRSSTPSTLASLPLRTRRRLTRVEKTAILFLRSLLYHMKCSYRLDEGGPSFSQGRTKTPQTLFRDILSRHYYPTDRQLCMLKLLVIPTCDFFLSLVADICDDEVSGDGWGCWWWTSCKIYFELNLVNFIRSVSCFFLWIRNHWQAFLFNKEQYSNPGFRQKTNSEICHGNQTLLIPRIYFCLHRVPSHWWFLWWRRQ